MSNILQNKFIQFHEKIVFDFLKKIRNYLVANPILSKERNIFTILHVEFDLNHRRGSKLSSAEPWLNMVFDYVTNSLSQSLVNCNTFFSHLLVCELLPVSLFRKVRRLKQCTFFIWNSKKTIRHDAVILTNKLNFLLTINRSFTVMEHH